VRWVHHEQEMHRGTAYSRLCSDHLPFVGRRVVASGARPRRFGYEDCMWEAKVQPRARWIWPPVLVLGACLLSAPNLKAARGGAAVATENATASREALSILRRGGTAVDAAVTAALVAGVTSPSSSGLGGGGFALAYDAKTKRTRALDFRERAPRDLDTEAFERRPLRDEDRGVLFGVPGELAGLVELHRLGGRLPLSSLIERAELRAKEGFFVAPHLAMVLATSSEKVRKSPYLAALYYPHDKPAFAGQRLLNPRLAETLRRLRVDGPSTFYEGDIADSLIAQANAHGAKMTRADFRDYRVMEREPVCRPFVGTQVCTMPAPSAGGLLLLEVLSLFSPDELQRLGRGTPAYQHLLAEGMRGALADRLQYLGDPEFEKARVETLLSETRLGPRRAQISLDRTHALPRFVQEEHGTHHLVVRDKEGNAVSLTTTVNRAFGAALADDVTGIVLNDQLDDFTANSMLQKLGMGQSPNRARPLARPVSSMTPVLVFRGEDLELALGGSGGLLIGMNVTQVLLDVLVFAQSPKSAVGAPRFFVPFEGKTLLLEGEPSDAQLESLAFRGELVGKMPRTSTAVQILMVKGERVEAASDPRKYGEALVDP
jgi:gamma-glutamyltranspeptidase / glutathione hydrolase